MYRLCAISLRPLPQLEFLVQKTGHHCSLASQQPPTLSETETMRRETDAGFLTVRGLSLSDSGDSPDFHILRLHVHWYNISNMSKNGKTFTHCVITTSVYAVYVRCLFLRQTLYHNEERSTKTFQMLTHNLSSPTTQCSMVYHNRTKQHFTIS